MTSNMKIYNPTHNYKKYYQNKKCLRLIVRTDIGVWEQTGVLFLKSHLTKFCHILKCTVSVKL